MSSAGMRLAGEDHLHGTSARVEDARQPLGIVKHQLRPLVAGEAAREPDRQRVGLEQRAGGDDARDADVLFGPALARAFADEREQIAAQRLAHRATAHRPGMASTPSQSAGSSCRSIHPAPRYVVNRSASSLAIQVGTCTPLVIARDGPILLRDAGPDRPHIARVTSPCSWLTALVRARRSERERRHVELRAAAVVVGAERQEPVAVARRACPSSWPGASRPPGTETRRAPPAPACGS